MTNTTPSTTYLSSATLQNGLFILLFLSVLAIGPTMLNTDGDLPRHLLMGKYVLETGAPPIQEVFAYPYEGRAYIPHEWLAGVIFYLLYLLLGLNGDVILAGVLIASTFALVYARASAQNKQPLFTFLLVLLGAVVTSIHWVARPHLFSMFFLALWVIWMERLVHAQPQKQWLFPALMFIWANTHAESIAGFLVLFAYIGGWFWQFFFGASKPSSVTGKSLAIVAGLSFGASLVNPTGIQAWVSVSNYINNSYLMSRIVETRPPDFTQTASMPLLLLLFLSAFLLIKQRKSFTPAHVFLIGGFGLMSLLSSRNAHLFGVVAPLILSVGLKEIGTIRPINNIETIFSRYSKFIGWKFVPIAIVLIFSIILLNSPLKNSNRFDPAVFPVDAVEWLKSNPPSGRMFNEFDWGGYLLLHLWPQQQVFIESQADTQGELTKKYEQVVTLQENWRGVFNEYEINWVIVSVKSPLAVELNSDSAWTTVYHDDVAGIYIRK